MIHNNNKQRVLNMLSFIQYSRAPRDMISFRRFAIMTAADTGHRIFYFAFAHALPRSSFNSFATRSYSVKYSFSDAEAYWR